MTSSRDWIFVLISSLFSSTSLPKLCLRHPFTYFRKIIPKRCGVLICCLRSRLKTCILKYALNECYSPTLPPSTTHIPTCNIWYGPNGRKKKIQIIIKLYPAQIYSHELFLIYPSHFCRHFIVHVPGILAQKATPASCMYINLCIYSRASYMLFSLFVGALSSIYEFQVT